MISRLFSYSTLVLVAALSITMLSTEAGAREVRVVKDKNIYRTSDILSSRGYHTVVPKSCVIFVPENLKGKLVTAKPKGQFILWDEFLKKNHGWLQKMEVTNDESLGRKPVSEAKMQRILRTGKVIIAVYKNRPVSMLQPKVKHDEVVKKEE